MIPPGKENGHTGSKRLFPEELHKNVFLRSWVSVQYLLQNVRALQCMFQETEIRNRVPTGP